MVSLYNELRRAGEDSGASVAQEVYSIFEQPLNPVAPKAQKKVRPPEGLDLDAQINEVPESESEDSESSESESESSSDREEGSWFPKHEKGRESEVKKVHRPQSAYILTGENARRPSREDFIEEHAEPPPVASVADLGIHGTSLSPLTLHSLFPTSTVMTDAHFFCSALFTQIPSRAR